ncbi:MAG: hypothetical protein AABZ41_00930 [Bacteroidota bacterium]
MKLDWVFLRRMIVGYVGLTAIALYLVSSYGEPEHLQSVIAGSIVSAVNFLLGFLAIEFAFEKSHTTFLKVILGGMGIRLFAMTGVVLVLIKIQHYDSLSLMLSLLGYYALNLTLEISFLQKKVSLKN